jgi:ribosomal protein L31
MRTFAIAALVGMATAAPVLTVREGVRQVYSASTTQEYVDAGASCVDGDQTLPVTTAGDHNEISLATIGTYKVQYTCADQTATRTVVVVPTLDTGDAHHSFQAALPSMHLNDGAKQYYQEEPADSTRSYVDKGATCTYGEHDISNRVSIMGDTVDLKVQGIYKIKYECEARDGAAATVLERQVYVGPKQANDFKTDHSMDDHELDALIKANEDAVAASKVPVIKLNGADNMRFQADDSDTWTDPGASCFYKGEDVSQFVEPKHEVIRLREPGVHTVKYTCKLPNRYNNAKNAKSVERVVTVTETPHVACTEGQFLKRGTCEPCEAGTMGAMLTVTYLGKSHKVLGCKPCADGWVQEKTGQTSCRELAAADRCRTEGYFTSAVTGECEQCKAFSYEEGNVCKTCPAGKWSQPGALACQFSTCVAGTYQKDDGTCDDCQSGRYQDKGFTTATDGTWGRSFCFHCPEGAFNFKTGQTQCKDGTECGKGTYVNPTGVGNRFNCRNCKKGTASNKKGQMTCDVCQAKHGQYAPASGLKKCLQSQCAVGYYSRKFGTKAHLQDLIAKDTGSTMGAKAHLIKKHAAADTGHGSHIFELCTKCGFNTYQDHEGQPTCNACAAGTFAGFGWAKCEKTTCGKGTYAKAWEIQSTGHKYERCIDCPKDTFADNEVANSSCTPCTAGSYAPKLGSTQCQAIECKPGEYQDGSYSQKRCLKCPPGTFSDTATTQCTPCTGDRWTFAAGATSCTYETSCSVGTHWDTTTARCVPCAVGRFAAKPNQAACDACPVGTYQFSTGQNTCKKIVCNPGEFMSEKWGKCMSCKQGEWSSTGSLTYCYKCPRGYFNYKFGQTSCTASKCSPGTFQSETPADKKNDEGMPYSVRCNRNNAKKEEACKGQINNNKIVHATTTCHRCPLNTYQPLGSMFYCFKCPSGKHTHFKGQQTCTTEKQCYTTHNGVFCTGVRRQQSTNPEVCQNVKCAVHEWNDNLGTQHRRVRVTHVPGTAITQSKFTGNEPAETRIMNWAKENDVDKLAFYTAHHICRSNYATSTETSHADKLKDCTCWCW